MSVYNFFRDIFGFRRNDQQQTSNYEYEEQWRDRDDFRNPIWQTGEDDDEDGDDFRQPGRRDFGFGHFSIHSDPFEVARFFENQMNEMLQNFFGFSGDGGMMLPFGERIEDNFQSSLPSIEAPTQGNLRDEVLKPENEIAPSKSFGVGILEEEKDKVDLDLDGKIITSDELSKIWKDRDSFESIDSASKSPKKQSPFLFHSFGQSVSVRVIQKSDGSVEQHRTVKDSEGNEETTVTQQIGDKTRTVVIKKDKNGRQTETETETETIDPIIGSIETSIPRIMMRPFLGITARDNDDVDVHSNSQNPLQDFPWHKFFNPNPKL